MSANLTVSSQSINADKKIDSFYCYGPGKTREIAKMKAISQAKDTLLEEKTNELDLCEFIFKKYQAAYSTCDSAQKVGDAQLQHKDIQLEAKESENKGMQKQLKKAKAKEILTDIITTVSIGGNIILGIKLASK